MADVTVSRELLQRVLLHFQKGDPSDARYTKLSPEEIGELFIADCHRADKEGERIYADVSALLSLPDVEPPIVAGHMLANAAENLLDWLGKTIRAEEVEIKATDIGAEGTTKRMNDLAGAIKAMRAALPDESIPPFAAHSEAKEK